TCTPTRPGARWGTTFEFWLRRSAAQLQATRPVPLSGGPTAWRPMGSIRALSTTLVVILGFLCIPRQAPLSPQQRFPDDTTVEAWQQYERFSRSLQGTITHKQIPDMNQGSKGKVNNVVTTLKQNARCTLIRSANDRLPHEYITMENAKYTAEIRLPKKKT